MSRVATVYLAAPVGPDGKSHHSGYVDRHSEIGVWLNSREDGRGESTFYPVHQVNRIDFNTGWL
ncbi:MAG TPA: hypothetical protein VIQ29_04295 [Ancylobacter sp.]